MKGPTMRINRRLWLSSAIAFAAMPALAKQARGPGEFSFLVPGTTTRDEVVRRLGKPEIDSTTFILIGEIDPFQNVPTESMLYALHDRAGVNGEVVETPILGYRLEGWPLMHAKLIFRNDVLLYALLPIGPSETTRDKLVERLGKKPRVIEFRQTIGDVRQEGNFYWFDRHTAYFGFRDDQIWERIVF
jgi:hypothetical protein